MPDGSTIRNVPLLIDGQFRQSATGHWRDIVNPANQDGPGTGAARDHRRSGRGGRVRQGRLRHLAQDADRHAGPCLPQVPAADPRTHEGARRDSDGRAGQDAGGCRRRRVPRTRGRRARSRHRQPATGRTGQQRGINGVDTYTLLQPLGVCAGITPFNFPAMIPLWMFPMAIATGNTFVLKPSEQDPMVTMRLVELALEAGRAARRAERRSRWRRRPSTRSATTLTSRRSRSSDRRKVGTHVYQRATARRQARAMHDGREEPRDRHARRPPRSRRSTRWPARAFGAAGQRCMAVSVAVMVGEAPQLDRS